MSELFGHVNQNDSDSNDEVEKKEILQWGYLLVKAVKLFFRFDGNEIMIMGSGFLIG